MAEAAPNVLAGGPFCISVQMIEVQSQVEPLFSLGVLEVAAKSIGISLRLETCPAEDGASWLLLKGIGRIPVSRIDGLVRVGFRMISPGHILIGCESAHSALVDTGAQVCLFSKLSMLTALAPSPYAGPPLRGADNAFVECKSAASFTVHFDLSALLPCLDRRVMVVRSAPAAVQEVSADGSLYVRIREEHLPVARQTRVTMGGR